MHRNDSNIRFCQRVSKVRQASCDIRVEGEYVSFAFFGQRDNSVWGPESHRFIIYSYRIGKGDSQKKKK